MEKTDCGSKEIDKSSPSTENTLNVEEIKTTKNKVLCIKLVYLFVAFI